MYKDERRPTLKDVVFAILMVSNLLLQMREVVVRRSQPYIYTCVFACMLQNCGLVLAHSLFLFFCDGLRITGKLPGYLSPSAGLKFADVPNGLAAISKVPAAGWGQILAYMAFCEVSQDQSPGTPAAAGDFGFKVLTSSDPAEKTKKLSAELANGRLAMMAIIGMFFQDVT